MINDLHFQERKFYLERVDTYIDIEKASWLEGECGDENCTFCKDRGGFAYNKKYQKVVLELYMCFTSVILYPKWTTMEQKTLKKALSLISDWIKYDIYEDVNDFSPSDWQRYMESIVFLFRKEGEEFYGSEFKNKYETIKELLYLA